MGLITDLPKSLRSARSCLKQPGRVGTFFSRHAVAYDKLGDPILYSPTAVEDCKSHGVDRVDLVDRIDLADLLPPSKKDPNNSNKSAFRGSCRRWNYATACLLLVALINQYLRVAHQPLIKQDDLLSDIRIETTPANQAVSEASQNLVRRSDLLSDIRIETMAASDGVNRTIERGLTFLQLWAQANGVELTRIATVNVDGNLSRIATVNVDGDGHLSSPSTTAFFAVPFTDPSPNIKWKDIFPEWIDESRKSSCPEIPEPAWFADDFRQAGVGNDQRDITAAEHSSSPSLVARSLLGSFDGVVASLPCEQPADSWARDVRWHHLMLTIGRLVTKSTSAKTPVLLFTECRPPPNLFRCRDLVMHEGPIWLYHVAPDAMRERLQPIGSCQLAHPATLAKGEVAEGEIAEVKIQEARVARVARVAYASVLHTTEDYVCGAIVLARSLKKSGTKADLVLLVSREISAKSRRGLKKAGWRLKEIERIRNPHAVPKTYNEWNYSKLRLWQMEEYDKVVFVDSDILVLKNLDFLFGYPELSARGNARHLFNSGVMVLEPSNCTFNLFMSHVTTLTSCNGGDQGFLNNVFAWWHRLPETVSMLKYAWHGGGKNKTEQREQMDRVFSADPPRVHAIHYLGRKPWQCYREFDCTWLYPWDHQYVSDAAHARWWKVHDQMRASLQEYCWLPNRWVG
ncbi:hypothetical protein CLOM_g3915 [Closterium sp. NIES-68]|nr:hypothetical protein CLOM_g3915 [Closterium sp. NIES-68]